MLCERKREWRDAEWRHREHCAGTIAATLVNLKLAEGQPAIAPANFFPLLRGPASVDDEEDDVEVTIGQIAQYTARVGGADLRPCKE